MIETYSIYNSHSPTSKTMASRSAVTISLRRSLTETARQFNEQLDAVERMKVNHLAMGTDKELVDRVKLQIRTLSILNHDLTLILEAIDEIDRQDDYGEHGIMLMLE
jgi:hypothetical protein